MVTAFIQKPVTCILDEMEPEKEEEELFEVFAVEEQPERINTVIPEYPQLAKDSNVQGNVILKVLVNEKGVVDSVVVINGPVVFYESSIKAAKALQFNPAKINDKAVSCWVIIPFKFELKS
jgi:protein TonB